MKQQQSAQMNGHEHIRREGGWTSRCTCLRARHRTYLDELVGPQEAEQVVHQRVPDHRAYTSKNSSLNVAMRVVGCSSIEEATSGPFCKDLPLGVVHLEVRGCKQGVAVGGIDLRHPRRGVYAAAQDVRHR